MDLELVGRHALLFDDDATAEVVNSGASLVPWAAAGAADLLLDRHDVRHLLDRVPPRPRRSYSAALLAAPSPDGVSEAELDRERFLDLPAVDCGGEGPRDVASSGNGTDTGQSDYNAVPFSYGSSAGSDYPNTSSPYYRPPFPVPESLLNKLMVGAEMKFPTSDKAHQIIARTALFVSEHGGQSEIVLRVKQGNNPTFGFLMPDHHLHSYFRYLVDHPQLLKDDVGAVDTNKDYRAADSETEHAAPPGGALSLLGTVYESGDEDEDMILPSSESIVPGNDVVVPEEAHVGSASVSGDEEIGEDQKAANATAVKDKPIFTKKNPMFTGNSIVAARREKIKDGMIKSTTSAMSQKSMSYVSDTKEVILEPPSYLKSTMEKIVEFILRNGKEFEGKLIEQDRTTGRFPFLLPSNPYHSYYLKILQETQESKLSGASSDREDRNSSGRKDRSSERKDRRSSSEHKDRRSSSERKDRRSSSERKDRRSSSERKDRRSSSERKDRSSSEHKDSSHGKEGSKSKMLASTSKDSSSSDRSSAEPSEKQLFDKQRKGKIQMIIGAAKKEPRNVTADEAAAIVMAATRGVGHANLQPNTLKDTREIGHNHGNNSHTSSFGSLSSLQDPDELSKHASNSEAAVSVTNSGQLQKEGTGIIDDDWITNTIAKAAAVAALKEADSSEVSMTKEQKLKAERLRRAKMFAAIVKSGGDKVADLGTTTDPTIEPRKASPAYLNLSGSELPSSAKEREGSSVPFEREGSDMIKMEKESDDEQNRARNYRKKHNRESGEEKDDSEESYKHSRKRHRSEHSAVHTKDAYKHKHKRHPNDLESNHRRHHHSSSEDEREHKSSKSRHRHKDDDHYHEDDGHRSSRRHRRDNRSSSKRKHENDRERSEKSLDRSETSQSTSGYKFESDQIPRDTAQSSEATTEVPNELRAKIRAMLLETL